MGVWGLGLRVWSLGCRVSMKPAGMKPKHVLYRDVIGVLGGLCRDTGKEHGNYYIYNRVYL